MAITNGLFGTTTGKAGGLVFSKVGDKMVVRAYNDKVSNPQTPAQMEQRAKFKLLNQLAAIYAPFIAMKKSGLVTPRNKFVKVNTPLVEYHGDTATIALADIQMTESSIALCGFTANRADDVISFNLERDMRGSIDGVAYLVMALTDSQEIIPYKTYVTSHAGDAGNFPGQIADPAGDIVVYAYGFRYNTKAGVSNFGQLNVTTADALAHLYASSDLSKAIGSFTETRGFLMAADDSQGSASGQSSVNIVASAWDQNTASASVTGWSNITRSVLPGASVTVEAPELSGYRWIGWYDSARNSLLSANRSYTFTASVSMNIVAVYTSSNTQGED